MSRARIIWSWTASVVTGKVEHSVEAAGHKASVAYWPRDEGEGVWSLKAVLSDADGECINHFTAAFADADAAKAATDYHKVRLAKILRRKLKRADVLAAAGHDPQAAWKSSADVDPGGQEAGE